MSILINKDTRVIVQGITGSQGLFHTQQMLEYGTKVVGGVTPGKGGTSVLNVPVFNTVRDAVRETGANCSIIYVPPAFAADAILEAADAGIPLVVTITEGIPVLDMVKVKRYLEDKETRLIGPNCPGILTAEESKVGIMPGYIHRKGHVGVISRSGTLTYEAVDQLSKLNIGQTTAVGIGGDPVIGTSFVDILELFNQDPDTYAVVMIGEIGGTSEEEAAVWAEHNMNKPLIAFIGGRTAPPGKRMGHAGAIISGGKGTADEKISILKSHGIAVADTPAEIGETMALRLKERGLLQDCLIHS